MNYEEVQKDCKDAEKILKNPFYQKIWAQLLESHAARELKVNTAKEPELAADYLRYRQILHAFKRSFDIAIQKGYIAEQELIKELGKNKKRKLEFKRDK